MFKKIMVPVDLAHLDRLARSLEIAATLAREDGAEIVCVGIYGNLPSSAARNPKEYKARMEAFAAEHGASSGVKTTAFPVFSHDPEVELGSALLKAIDDTGADAVVMASHIPGWVEHIFHSNAGYIASHATISVFVIR